MLTGTVKSLDELDKNDWRHIAPRFHGQAFDQNMKLVDAIAAMAQKHQVTTSQIALAWLLSQGNDIFPIPGTKRIQYLDENFNAIQVQLTQDDLQQLGDIIAANPIQGERYPELANQLVDRSE
jgi:aryl-alcohol dehydrogenase-like predicted oxidoreductase